MSESRLDSAMYDLEQLSIKHFRSDPERDDAMRRQYEYIIHCLVDEVQALKERLAGGGK